MIQFKLDLKSGVPFHRQIVDQIRFGIASGRLLPGEQLPTVRDLAVQLEINPNTVRKAYSDLELLGILDTQQGTGTFVSDQQVEIGDAEKQPHAATNLRRAGRSRTSVQPDTHRHHRISARETKP